jgi:hypothetical protein
MGSYLAKRLAIVIAAGMATSASAQERLEMEGTSIIGNKELPKVLYIVPWKSAPDIELETPAYRSVLDEAMQPVERPSFQRQVNYYHQLYPQSSERE